MRKKLFAWIVSSLVFVLCLLAPSVIYKDSFEFKAIKSHFFKIYIDPEQDKDEVRKVKKASKHILPIEFAGVIGCVVGGFAGIFTYGKIIHPELYTFKRKKSSARASKKKRA